eukprot:sb/3469848/
MGSKLKQYTQSGPNLPGYSGERILPGKSGSDWGSRSRAGRNHPAHGSSSHSGTSGTLGSLDLCVCVIIIPKLIKISRPERLPYYLSYLCHRYIPLTCLQNFRSISQTVWSQSLPEINQFRNLTYKCPTLLQEAKLYPNRTVYLISGSGPCRVHLPRVLLNASEAMQQPQEYRGNSVISYSRIPIYRAKSFLPSIPVNWGPIVYTPMHQILFSVLLKIST